MNMQQLEGQFMFSDETATCFDQDLHSQRVREFTSADHDEA